MVLDEQIDVTPIGRFIIGVNGRIDLESSKGRVRCVLVPENVSKPRVLVGINEEGVELSEKVADQRKNQKYVWKFVVESQEIRYVDMNVDTFSDVILELIGPNEEILQN